MKIKNGFELCEICGENIIVAYGAANVDFTKLLTLNESAAYLWKQAVEKDFSEEDLVQALLAEYEVSEEQAKADVKTLLDSWQGAGLLED